MRRTLSMLLIVGFVGVAVFGFVSMGHIDGRSYDSCIAAAVQGIACVEESSSYLFHFGAYKSFSTITLEGDSNLALELALIFALAVYATYGVRVALPRLPMFRFVCFSRKVLPSHTVFTRLLALHENSPSLL